MAAVTWQLTFSSVFLYSASNQLWLATVHKAPLGKAAVTPPVTDCVQVSIPEAPTQCLLPEPLCQGFTHALQPPPCSQSQQQGPGSETALPTTNPRSLFHSKSTITTGLATSPWLLNCLMLLVKLEALIKVVLLCRSSFLFVSCRKKE